MVPDTTQEHVDKWEALQLLTDASERYGLSHRSLGVLRALMTFLPGRLITPMPHEAIVFPSNRTLSSRLNGMPESTLRRHLAHLVAAGIVSRRSSPNHKRFARRAGGLAAVAFGFDLSPLARHIEQLRIDATEQREAHEALLASRARLISLRHAALMQTGDTELTETARQTLRRKPVADELERLCAQFDALEAANTVDAIPDETSGTDDQNERHIQIDLKPNSDLEKPVLKKTTADNQGEGAAELLDHCQAYKDYFPDPPQRAEDICTIAETLGPMINIDSNVLRDAMKAMGQFNASVVVLWMLERITEIRNPGGYLRHLTKLSRAGGFSIKSLLKSIQIPEIVS